ncbi:E3 ubiquitin-protein ligase rnf213-alpha-like, partial [Saccostrea cucullata]|uniref:E3 ubiquitin-protein ligase rnf213-alpha-like n=1 Tax=Saccostrea cuccullata TaxID=36930 RepID=UPI002ED400AC
VTINSKLITTVDVVELSQYLHIAHTQITLLNLQSFDTEQQFCRQIKQSFERDLSAESLLIVQCDSGNENASLVACAQYSVLDQLQQLEDEKTGKTHIVFIIHLPRVAGGGFTGFQCGLWHSVHIDDLRPDDDKMPSFLELRNKSVGTLLESAAGPSKSRDTKEMDWEGRSDHDKQETEDIEMEYQDVYLHDFGSMMERTEQVHVEKKVDFPFFIKLTALPALAMVKDPAEDSARTTERVKILLALLHQETKEKVTFMKGVGRHLAALMKEKEENIGQSAESWLYSEATNMDCINRVGAFRKARNECIIEKLSPMLAGIIAQVDTNSNLDLLIKTDPDTWQHKLWLEIINEPSATHIEYSVIMSPKRQQELPEMIVRGTGCDGQKFSAQVPFSWLIYKMIYRTIWMAQDVEKHETIQDLVKRVTDVIENTPIGKVLQKCLCKVGVLEFVKPYLSDFVYMVYHVTSVEEHGLVCENLLNGMNMDFKEGLQSVVMNFVAIHAVYNRYVPRLRNFASITQVWPECSAKIIEFQQKSPQFYLVTTEELTLDILGLYLLLQSLEPGKDSLNDNRGRQYWQRQVLRYRPVVERILGQFVEDEDPSGVEQFGRRCREGSKEARCQWTKVVVMKLFLQHVCAEDTAIPVERCKTLWVMLKDNVNFKNIEALEKMEKFLKMCMKKAVTTAFGRLGSCKACTCEITERPIQLPCKDVICIKCYNDTKILRSTECPVCHDAIPNHFNPHQVYTKNLKMYQLRVFQRHCNSFFMDLVSQLCFTDEEPPSSQVIQKLMSYMFITTRARRGQGGRMATKELSVFEEGIDPTPVLRSFLLQYLIRTSSGEECGCLQIYLEQVEELMSLNENKDKMIELSLLVINCLEDSLHQEVTKSVDPEKSKIKMATQMLQHNVHLVMKEGLDVQKLYCMAETRFGLIVVAEILHKLLVEKSIKMGQSVRRLLEAAGRLCDECGSKQPKLFLIKHLCRCFGLETYQKVCKTSDAATVRWLSVPELQKNEIAECSDRFIVCGEQYKTLREKLTQATLGQNMDLLNTALESVRVPDFQKRTLALLAIFREITMSYLYPENKRRVTAAAVELLHQFRAQHPLFVNQNNLPMALCRNALWRRNPQLTVQEGMDLGHQSKVCLLNHFFITLLQIPEKRTLIEPLNKLVQQPQDMQGAFLPTMPQDNVAEMREALLAARGVNDANPVFYRCPNGHPYVIGNCGRPAIVGRCKDCGQEIGGQGHQLIAGNILDQGLDQTATGHILGRADGRQPVASPERSLSPIECAIVRLFAHMAMYLGASINLQAIQSIIKPDLDPATVLPFLWAHIEKDFLTIQKAIGKSVDDVYILIHRICNDIMEKHRGTPVNQEICFLANKSSRKKWEEDFTQTYLSPVLQEMNSFLKSLNKQLANDQRLGSDPLLCLIDIPSEHSSPSTLHNVPAVWRYRSQITMDHLLHTLQVQGRAHQVLTMFLQEEHHLRAIRLVPNILKLQRMLIQRYQRKLDRIEASRISIEDMIESYENEGRAEEIKRLVRDFIEAWQCVREQILTFAFPTLEGLARVPKEYCHKSINESHPISVLLPTFRDAGLCSYGLLYFLLKKQNNFLQEYCKKKKMQYTQLPKVPVNDVTSPHLISYHPERDILPMVLANCHYTFQVGKGTKIDYNFVDLERQLMDRFLFSKSVIDMPVYEFEMMTYRSETTNAVVFRHLRQKIKQEPLTPAVANQISEEIRAYPDLCQTLDKLDITISFLKSVGGDANMSLEKFMTQTLKMENPFPSQKARSSCMCKHTQSLWITLAMEKTKRQASHKEDAFEGVSGELRVDLLPDQRDIITTFCEELSVERLELLLETLFECIMLTITVPKGTDDDDLDMTKLSLRDTMIGYLSAPQYDLDLTYPRWMTDLVGRILNEGENFTKIMNNQAVDVWLFLYAIYSQKRIERR